MEKIIKCRLFTWFEEVDSPTHPGNIALTERINHMGETVDITNPTYVTRGESLDAFYTDAEADQIRAGTYAGPDADILYRRLAGIKPVSTIQPVEGEGPDVSSLDAEQLAEYIQENRLTGPETVALAGSTTESIEKVIDAENIASDNSPRKNVIEPLEAKLAEAGSSENGG